MPDLAAWFQANRALVFFVYGQVFFIMGLAIALQSRRYSRLPLARSLPWLAAFGLIHGINEWGDLFLPLQAEFVPAPWIDGLRTVQLVLLAASFACLLQFGIALLQPLPARWRWLRWLPGLIAGLWFLHLVGHLALGQPNVLAWRLSQNALVRYALGLPGGLVAAYGLWHQTRRHIAPLGVPHIYRMLQLAGLSLLAYAVFGGLIVPPAPFFPAYWLNGEWLTRTFIAPPQVWRSVCGLVLAFAIIRALEIFEVETDQLIERMEQAQVVAVERERIGRDLHDGAIQRLYAAGLLAQSLRQKAQGPVAEGLDRLLSTLNEALADLRAFLVDLRPGESAAAADLPAALQQVVDETRRASGLEVRYTPIALPPLPAERVNHLATFTREALSNAARHAQAHTLAVTLRAHAGQLWLTIRDDGRGMPENVTPGYGLRNMRDRARLVGGEIQFEPQQERGTAVTLQMPL